MTKAIFLVAIAVACAGCTGEGEPARVAADGAGGGARSDGRGAAAKGSVAAADLPDVVDLSQLPPLGDGDIATEVIEGANAYAAEHQDHFAGMLGAGGFLWVGFTHGAAEHLAELRSRVAPEAPVRAFTATFTEVELRALQALVTADMSVLHDRGVNVSMVAVSVPRNRVEIGIADDDDAAVELLRRRYGADRIHVERGVVVQPVGR
ncbi:MAG TPA: hypothetical protein VF230_02090 [Acidimicrobiales bacterium]